MFTATLPSFPSITFLAVHEGPYLNGRAGQVEAAQAILAG